ncbi:MAG TPA: IPT/TIG domain-containing protein [Bryobacteraceae bacterium]|jgi:hypothetical protein|nr:IPT/TIG domain-containing protein [Bryobacteraceae bacterium]
MKRRTVVVFLLGLATGTVWAFQGSPSVTIVDPDTGKVGDAVTAKGANLGKSHVAEVYLTDNKKDTKLEVIEQTDEAIKFKVPTLAPGRYRVLVLTANRASLIEEPVIFTVAE